MKLSDIITELLKGNCINVDIIKPYYKSVYTVLKSKFGGYDCSNQGDLLVLSAGAFSNMFFIVPDPFEYLSNLNFELVEDGTFKSYDEAEEYQEDYPIEFMSFFE